MCVVETFFKQLEEFRATPPVMYLSTTYLSQKHLLEIIPGSARP